MLKEQSFDTGVVTINYAEGPASGPPLVLVHGGGDWWQIFLPLLPTLILRWHVFALDLRGHGKSGRVAGQYLPEHYAQDVSAFLEHRVDGRAILFGHSLGGWVALLVAAQQQEKIEALILGDPPLNIEQFLAAEGGAESRARWRELRALARSDLSVPELAARLTASPLSPEALLQAKGLSLVDPDAAQYHAEGRLDEYVAAMDVTALLRQLQCPVLLLQGDPSLGVWILEEDAKHVLNALAHGVAARLDGKGHNLGLITWEVAPLLRAITGFLESL